MKTEWGGVVFGFDFIASFFLGGIILTIVCYERFGQPVKNGGSFVSTLLPEHLASKQDYLKAFLVYLFIMLMIYSLASIIGPNAYKAFQLAHNIDVDTQVTGYSPSLDASANGTKNVFEKYKSTHAPAWMPLLVMMILSGLSTNYKAFNQIELIVRKLTHRIIGIPGTIEELARSIQLAKIDIPTLNESDQNFIERQFEFATGRKIADIGKYYEEIERSDPIRRWIRLQFLFDRLENRRQAIGQVIDINVLQYYSNMWNEIKLSMFKLADKNELELVGRKSEFAAEQQMMKKIQAIESKIDETLHNLHALIAASVARRCHNSRSVAKAMAALGLTFEDVEKKDFVNAVIAGIFVMTTLVFLIVFITSKLDRFLEPGIYAALPTKPYDSFMWATGALFLHGSAALAAWQYQESRYKKKSWEPLNIRQFKIPSKQYLFLSVKVYVCATLSLFFWYLATETLKQGPFRGLSIEQIWIPLFGLVGVITGIYVAYTIDLCTRPNLSKGRMFIQPLYQAFFTALMSYIIMSILNFKESLNLYVGAITAMEGLTIGVIVLTIARQIHLRMRGRPK
jgi:hypothetical protein